MKRFIAVMAPLALVLMLVPGCQSQDTDRTASGSTTDSMAGRQGGSGNIAHVRLINVAAGHTMVDGYVDNMDVFSSVAFKSATSYMNVPDGNHTFHLGNVQGMQGGNNETFGTSVDSSKIAPSEKLSGGSFYTVVVGPSKDSGSRNDNRAAMHPEIRVITDKLGSLSADKAHVRVLHEAPSVDDVDVWASTGDSPLIKNVGFNDDDSYTDIDPINSTLKIRRSGKNDVVATLPMENFEAGKAYTILLVGSRSTSRTVEGVVIKDDMTNTKDTRSSDRQGGSED